MSNWVSLHNHSSFSIRDSVAKIPELVSRAKELGMTSLGISDHGIMSGVYKFYKECKKKDIHPVIGFEGYMFDDIVDEKINYHICLYAKNNIGYKNLCKLSSDAYINSFYKKPRVSFESLNQYKEGIIVSSACLQGLPQQLLIAGEIDKCNSVIDKFHRMFGESYYLELHNHGVPEEEIVRNHFRNYGREKGIKVIAATDCHMVNISDRPIHNILKAISYNSIGKANDDAFDGDGYHLMSYEEMLERFNKEEIDNTNEIADKCDVSFDFIGYHLPKFPIPVEDKDSYEYLKDLCYKGLKEKSLEDKKEYVDRLEYELNMLHMADLENYILIVADYCNWCKENNIIVGPGRGSFAGSLISFLTGITKVDPLKYNLMFQRAVNTGRILQYQFGV